MAKRPSPADVVDLCFSSSDDDEGGASKPAAANAAGAASSLAGTSHAAASAAAGSSSRRSRRSLDGVRKRLKQQSGETPKPVKKETLSDGWWRQEDDRDEVMVVQRQQQAIIPVAAAAGAAAGGGAADAEDTDDDDGIQVVGTVNGLLLPHARHDCTVKPFQADTSYSLHMRNTVNREFCPGCYCYVCDCKAGACRNWNNDHCLASDKGHQSTYWQSLRQTTKASRDLVQQQQQPTGAARAGAAAITPRFAAPVRGRFRVAPRNAIAPGSNNATNATNNNTKHGIILPGAAIRAAAGSPYPSDSGVARRNPNLTKCRHVDCGWYSSFSHKNFKFAREIEAGTRNGTRRPQIARNEINPTGYRDWCHACGRVASERDFEKVRSIEFDVDTKPNAGMVLLGTKTIAFRLKVHDPRRSGRYRDRWQKHEKKGDTSSDNNSDNQEEGGGWVYDEQAMEVELFRHRFGDRPTLEMIFESLSPLVEDKIPNSGTHKTQNDPEKWSASETEALLVDSDQDRSLLCDLYDLAPAFGLADRNSRMVDGEVRATWDGETRKGELTLRVFLSPSSAIAAPISLSGPRRAAMVQFFGSWYGIFPFKLTDLVGRGKAHYKADESVQTIEIPPFNLPESQQAKLYRTLKKTRKSIVKAYNKAVESREEGLALESGASALGGVCGNEVDFTGVLKRFFREVLPDVIEASPNGGYQLFVQQRLGRASMHRSLRKGQRHIVRSHVNKTNDSDDDEDDDDSEAESLGNGRYETQGKLTSFLSPEDFAAATTDLVDASKRLMRKTKTFDGLLNHLDNLGHASAPHVEGLTVDLLPFQKQSLQWALEREKTPGGLQAFFWPKLPSVEQPNTEAWFNPIIGKWTTSKPHLVRGGIIAEQMGLGKTVISLAMILCNPAPALPASGSNVADLPPNPDTSDGKPFWDPDLNQRVTTTTTTIDMEDSDTDATTTTKSSKRGTILSQGTLVVCTVSLVGQWIEEAKSKLSDPGLVYSYHGQSRKRDPLVLAQNSIVVTTFETLASDATYHKEKSEDDDYSPPCEQVRWWRIIVDESHQMRLKSGKSSAAMDLVGDHKWLVTGTPVNTSLMDLKNQMQFIGIQKVSEMFNIFRDTVLRHVDDPQSSKKKEKKKKRSRFWYMLNQPAEAPRGAPWTGHFTFLMNTVMIRHTQNMLYKNTTTSLMSLPPKSERTVVVRFNKRDKAEYKVIEKDALAFYKDLKENDSKGISKQYLKLTQKLVPLRTACAGGRIPLLGEYETNEDAGDDDDNDEDGSPRAKRKKIQKFSEYGYTSKLDKLVKELESIRDNDPTSKSLVFSQFQSSLDMLQQELPKRGFQFRTLKGDMSMRQRANALADFQNDPPTTIFLLNVRAGACGINLTEANRVFLLEPMLNPAIERQAIGRVYRLGQKREVQITHLVMESSVESRIVKMLKKKYKSGGGAPEQPSNGDEAAAEVDDDLAIQVGSLTRDKNSLLTEEFDLLFGWSDGDRKPAAAQAAAAQPAAAKPAAKRAKKAAAKPAKHRVKREQPTQSVVYRADDDDDDDDDDGDDDFIQL